MVDLATRVMIGEPLKDMGYGVGLYRTPPYFTVKVPVFSFEKLADANSYLGPEMKSTGEVLGIGKTLNEALFKGLTSAGMKIRPSLHRGEQIGVFISVDRYDQLEIISLAKKLDDLGFKLYATDETAQSIGRLGITVEPISGIRKEDDLWPLMEEGKIGYIIYTGSLMDSNVNDYTRLHRKALLHAIPCFTSLDTANAMADIIASKFNQDNTELVDINHMREKRQALNFSKMQATGDDYIFINNFDNNITCPESLCISLCDRHTGIGALGIVLMEASEIADAKMRMFNQDGSEGKMAGNCIRCVAKYLYDKGIVVKEEMDIETASGVKHLSLYTSNNKVTFVSVAMGKADLNPRSLPCTIDAEKIVAYPVEIGGKNYDITCVSVGNPHCVVFSDYVDGVPMQEVGPLFENAPIFPQRINTEFVRVVNNTTLKMRVFERGNGETMACGTGACAAVVAAVENGYCQKGVDITVKVKGGDLIVNYTDEGITLTGEAKLVYRGSLEY
jgi:carbamoyl-phosphate synthase large subunit